MSTTWGHLFARLVLSADLLTPVLLYHGIVKGLPKRRWDLSVESFRAQMEIVVQHGLVTSRAMDRPALERAGIPQVMISFDDGHAGVFDHAIPILEELGLQSTVYLVTDRLGTRGHVSASELESLPASVEIGSHSRSHPHLDSIPTNQLWGEIAGSRGDLEDIVSGPITSFAYPYGSHDSRVKRIAQQAGYENAYAVKNAISHEADDVFSLARLTVESTTPEETIRTWLQLKGAPLSWQHERLRTKMARYRRRMA